MECCGDVIEERGESIGATREVTCDCLVRGVMVTVIVADDENADGTGIAATDEGGCIGDGVGCIAGTTTVVFPFCVSNES